MFFALTVGMEGESQVNEKNSQGLEPSKILGKHDSTDENTVQHKAAEDVGIEEMAK